MTTERNAQGVCEGDCDSHAGPVVAVNVKTASGYDWGEFDYCEEAIATDHKRGLIVTPIQGATNAD